MYVCRYTFMLIYIIYKLNANVYTYFFTYIVHTFLLSLNIKISRNNFILVHRYLPHSFCIHSTFIDAP